MTVTSIPDLVFPLLIWEPHFCIWEVEGWKGWLLRALLEYPVWGSWELTSQSSDYWSYRPWFILHKDSAFAQLFLRHSIFYAIPHASVKESLGRDFRWIPDKPCRCDTINLPLLHAAVVDVSDLCIRDSVIESQIKNCKNENLTLYAGTKKKKNQTFSGQRVNWDISYKLGTLGKRIVVWPISNLFASSQIPQRVLHSR